MSDRIAKTTITQMNQLEEFGWNSSIQSAITNTKDDLLPGRIISIQGFKYFTMTEHGELEAELSGRLLYGATPEELPKLGDWVTLTRYDTLGYIIDVLPRMNELSRKNPGTKTQRQILATNIDYALIVQGLDRDFNIMRLERYLVQLASCNVKAIVILNKADLIHDRSEYVAEVNKLQRDCAVYFCSTVTGRGIDEIRDEVLKEYKTYILIGSSGVGKSSLLNAFMNNDVQHVSHISSFNNKGKHTTTTRDLFQLPNGSLVIDTPGMREFGLTLDEHSDTSDLFPGIQRFARDCRFADCGHTHEAGCAVLYALQQGTLEQEVYDSYIKLTKEQQRFTINAEDKKRMNKQSGKISREANNNRKKYKY